MKISEEVFKVIQQEKFYEKFDHIGLLDIPNEVQVQSVKRILAKAGKQSLLTKNSFFCFGIGYREIEIGTTFTKLFASKDVENYIDVKAKLTYVNLSAGRVINHLPKGYSGICLIEFRDGKLELLNRLKVYREKRDENKHDTLYLTQEPILSRILELRDKS